MKNVTGVLGLLVVLTAVGCKTTEPKADDASAKVVQEGAKAVEYFPLVPKVKWDELNGLQKTTAAIAIVPGCILSACANACLWAVN